MLQDNPLVLRGFRNDVDDTVGKLDRSGCMSTVSASAYRLLLLRAPMTEGIERLLTRVSTGWRLNLGAYEAESLLGAMEAATPVVELC